MSFASFSTEMSWGTGWEMTKEPRNKPKVFRLSTPKSLRMLTIDPTDIFLCLVELKRLEAKEESDFMTSARNRSFHVTPQSLLVLRSPPNSSESRENKITPLV